MDVVKFVRFRYGPSVQTVALYSGLPVEEFTKILKAILPVAGTVIGLQGENGAIVPISLACRSPDVLSGSLYVLLVDTSNSESNLILARETSEPSAPPMTSAIASEIAANQSQALKPKAAAASPPIAPPAPPLRPSTNPVYDDELSAEDSQLADDTMDELLRFIAGLRINKILSKNEAEGLEELLFENSSLIFAAYSVAKSAGDSQYLAELCLDIAQSLMTGAGQAACAAQEEILAYVDKLFLLNKITENQLLYLRHLTLVRDASVAKLYDDFQEHQNAELMLRDLYRLANITDANESSNNPRDDRRQNISQSNDSSKQQAQVKAISSSSGRSGKKENPFDKDYATRQSNTSATVNSSANSVNKKNSGGFRPVPNMSLTLISVLKLMLRAKDISNSEGLILKSMISDNNEYVVAAYELFLSDGDMDELQDTLIRCAKLEVRKRSVEMKAYEMATSNREENARRPNTAVPDSRANAVRSSYVTSPDRMVNTSHMVKNSPYDEEDSDSSEEEENDDEDVDEDEDEDDDDSQGSQDFEDNEAEDRPSDDEDEYENASNSKSSTDPSNQLDDLLSALGIQNIWENSVPHRFALTVFTAASRNILSIGQAKAICDLFSANYDLIRAAWEVFCVQNDVVDFIDTLLRIVRDMKFDQKGNIKFSNTNTKAGEKKDANKTSSKSEESGEIVADKAIRENEARARAARESKESALNQMKKAKFDLLRHSLEMMIQKSLVTKENAISLLERAVRGDALVEAAIETYANDRNVNEFLDTLQILASHSPEELDRIMRMAMEKQSNESGNVNSDDVRDDESNGEEEEEQEEASSSSSEGSAYPGEDGNVPSSQPLTATSHITDEDIRTYSLPQLELKHIVITLAEQNMINADVRDVLLQLVHENDETILGTHDHYRESNDMSDLVDSLIRIGREALSKQNARSKAASKEASGIEMQSLNKHKTKPDDSATGLEMTQLHSKENKSAEEIPLLTPSDQKSIIDILGKAGALGTSDSAYLSSLIDTDDRATRGVFRAYESNKDVYVLIEGLKRLLQSRGRNQDDTNGDENNGEEEEEGSEVEEEEEEGDEDDDDDGEEEEGDGEEDDEADNENDGEEEEGVELDEDDQYSIEVKFLNIVQNMNLSHLETAALRLAIARDDAGIRESLEVFRVDRNESNLMDTLHNIAKKTIEETLRGAGYDNGALDESSNPNNNDNEEEEEESEASAAGDSDVQGEGSAGNESDDDQDDSGDDDDDDEDNDDDDDDDDATDGKQLMSTQSARDHIFPILVSELSKENIISFSDGETLLSAFKNGDVVINAALDVYDLDSDMAELVDTLQRVANISNALA